MEFDKRNREALIEQLKQANIDLDRLTKVCDTMGEIDGTKSVLWQLVELEAKKVFIKMIEKSIADNHPFNLDLEFINK
jgi:hypothetical protein